MSRQFCVSEAEAFKKWCPQAGEQRMQRQDENCLGSDCMAWRWVETNIAGRDADGAPALVPSTDTHGYCGLAGKPE